MSTAANIYSQRLNKLPQIAISTKPQTFSPQLPFKSTTTTNRTSFKLTSKLKKSNNICYSRANEEIQEVNPKKVVEDVSSSSSSSSDENGSSTATKMASKTVSEAEIGQYPTSEEEEEGGFFPVREPGNWPPIDVKKKGETLDTAAEAVIEEGKEYDPLRDGPLRYLGYANELGEAFAAWLPTGGVPLSYAVAIAYVLVDTADKGRKAYQKSEKELANTSNVNPEVDCGRLTTLLAAERTIDTVVWQLLASVAFPGYTIHTVVAIIHGILVNVLQLENPNGILPAAASVFASIAAILHTDVATVTTLVDKSVPTFAGLITIPFIVHPIDSLVHAILNVSMRPQLRKFLCESGQGRAAGLTICDEKCMVTDFPILSEENSFIEAFTKSFEEE